MNDHIVKLFLWLKDQGWRPLDVDNEYWVAFTVPETNIICCIPKSFGKIEYATAKTLERIAEITDNSVAKLARMIGLNVK